MTKLLGVETRKIVAARSTWGIVAALIAFTTIAALQTAVASEVGKPLWERQAFFLATLQVQLFMLVLGAKTVTDEFRYGTIVSAVLVTPRRQRFVAAKLAVVTAVGAIAASLASGALVAASWRHLGDGLQGAELRSLAGLVAAGALWSLLGGAVGFLVKHQVGAIIGVVVWTMVLDQMLGSTLGKAAAYLPGDAAGALAVASSARSMLVGGLILMTWTVAAGAIATVVVRWRDVA